MNKMRMNRMQRIPRPDFSKLLTHESPWAAGYRLGLSEGKVKSLMEKGELVYAYSPKHKKKILVGDGYVERKKGKRGYAWDGGLIGGTIKYLLYGPKSPLGIVVWMLLLPVTLPIYVIFQCSMAFLYNLWEWSKNPPTTYYGGGGLFDEVSTARREDLQFLLGTGPYAKENW